MDIGCLIGLCSATAQGTSEVAAPVAQAAASAVAASTSAPAPDTSGSAGNRAIIGQVATFIGVLSAILAQSLAPTIIRRYATRMEALMKGKSVPARLSWTAEALLAGIERKRLQVVRVLVGVVLVYSLVAGLVLAIYSLGDGAQWSKLAVAVSFLMFASFSGPVVLLGVSASNFAKLFWTWFAPATFAAVAMQVMLASGKGQQEPRSQVLWALFAVALLTAVGVGLRRTVPHATQQRAWLWLKRRWLVGSLLLVLAAFVGLWVLLEVMHENTLAYLLIGSLAGAAAIGMCYFTMVDRIRRIVAPLVAAGLFTFVATTLGVLAAMNHVPDGMVLLVAAAALPLGYLAASFMLSWIGLAYEQKVFSDAQFQVFCWMITVAGVVVCVSTLVRDKAELFDPMNLWLLSATGLALLMYWLITRYRIRPLDSNKRLLVLRVFSKERRTERLLDELEYRWRFIGPIVLIGATDVAKRTIDPAKAAKFLRRRMEDIFVRDLDILDKRIAALDDMPDPDGRYRVNEFFCNNDTWQEAVRRLLDSSQAIVVDLSEFTADRMGTAWELGQLKERGALSRTVFLVSDQTDRDAVCVALHLPRGSDLPAGAVIRVDRSVDGAQLVETLVRRIDIIAVPAPAATAAPAGASV